MANGRLIGLILTVFIIAVVIVYLYIQKSPSSSSYVLNKTEAESIIGNNGTYSEFDNANDLKTLNASWNATGWYSAQYNTTNGGLLTEVVVTTTSPADLYRYNLLESRSGYNTPLNATARERMGLNTIYTGTNQSVDGLIYSYATYSGPSYINSTTLYGTIEGAYLLGVKGHSVVQIFIDINYPRTQPTEPINITNIAKITAAGLP